MIKRVDLVKVLASNEVAGRIIRDVASLEWELELLLTRYFGSQERIEEFWQLLIERFNLRQKIDILRKMQLPRKMKSQPNAVKSLEKFMKLRNILAHENFITSSKGLDRIFSDTKVKQLSYERTQ